MDLVKAWDPRFAVHAGQAQRNQVAALLKEGRPGKTLTTGWQPGRGTQGATDYLGIETNGGSKVLNEFKWEVRSHSSIMGNGNDRQLQVTSQTFVIDRYDFGGVYNVPGGSPGAYVASNAYYLNRIGFAREYIVVGASAPTSTRRPLP